MLSRLLALLLLAWLPVPALAGAKVEHPRGQLPIRPRLYPNGDPIPVWLAHAGCKMQVLPGPTAAWLTPAQPTRFMEMFFYADQFQIGEREYYLLVRSDEAGKAIKDYLGWVDKRHLVVRPEAMMDPATKIHFKGFIINSIDFLKSVKTNKNDLNKLEILDAPRADATGRDEPHRLHNILFIYSETEEHILLGGGPSFNPRLGEEDARKVVLGWLPRERICKWNTREGFEWDHESTVATDPAKRRRTPGKIYASAELAKQALTDSTVPGIFEEQFDDRGVSPKLKFDDPRFPILARSANHPRRGTLLHVGGVGGLYGTEGQILLGADKVLDLQRKLDRVRKEAARTEILFVIDDTSSMKDWFREVAAICTSIIDLVRQDSARDVHLAVAYYNDITDTNKQPVTTSVFRSAREHGQGIIDELLSHKPHDGADPLEMVNRGLIEAIDRAGFSSDARKIVVLLGDCGDITASPERLRDDPEYAKRFGPEKILERLHKVNQSPIDFFAVQVVDPNESEDYGAFAQQTKSLIARYQKQLQAGNESATVEYFTSREQKAVREKILLGYRRLDRTARAMQGQVERLKRGQWRTTQVTPELRRILERRGIDLDRLKGLDGYQVFEYGYVWSKSPEGLPQINERILINDGELQELIYLLGRLENRNPRQQPGMRELFTGVIKSQTGDRYKDDPERLAELTLSDIINESKGLMFRSSLLVSRLDRVGEDPLQITEYFHVLKQRQVLEDIRLDVRHEYKEELVSYAGKKVRRWQRLGDSVPAPRGFEIAGDRLRWYWIDYRKEWP